MHDHLLVRELIVAQAVYSVEGGRFKADKESTYVAAVVGAPDLAVFQQLQELLWSQEKLAKVLVQHRSEHVLSGMRLPK